MYTDKRYDREQIDKLVSQLSQKRSVKLAANYIATSEWDIETILNTLQEDIESFDDALISIGNTYSRQFIETLKFAIEYDHAQSDVIWFLESDESRDARLRHILEAAVGYTPERKTKSLGKDYDKLGLTLQAISEFTSDLDYYHNLRSVRMIADSKDEAYMLASDSHTLAGVRMRTNRPDIIAREEHGSWQIAKNEHNAYKIFEDGKIIASDTEHAQSDLTKYMIGVIPPGIHRTYFGHDHADEWTEDEFFSIDELDVERLLALCHYIEKFVRNQKRMSVIYKCFENPPQILTELGERLWGDTPYTSYVSEFEYRPIFCVDSGRSRGIFNADLIVRCLRLFHTAGIKKIKLTAETTDRHSQLVTATSWRRPMVFTPATSELDALSKTEVNNPTYVMTLTMPISCTDYEDYADFTTLI